MLPEALSQKILDELIVTETPHSYSGIENESLTFDLRTEIVLCAFGKGNTHLVLGLLLLLCRM